MILRSITPLPLAAVLRRLSRHAWVDTLFGARAIYERLGCRAFGELAGFPHGHARSFLKKDLQA
jgi:hypothetical protein